MLDIKYIRESKNLFKDAATKKGLNSKIIDILIEVDEKRRELIQKTDMLRAEHKKTTDRKEATELKNRVKKSEEELKTIEKQFEGLMNQVPTILAPDTPIGKKDADNLEIYHSGKIPEFNFKPKDHIELAKNLNVIDFERGVKVSGFRGYYLKNEVAILALSLMMYALRKMIE